MYILKENEKKTPAIFYISDTLFLGEVITTKIVRVNIWLRTESAPKYVRLQNVQMISLSSAAQSIKLDEAYVPVDQIIAYHVTPEVEVQIDYNENEPNRRMLPMQAFGPSFLTFKGENRISSQTDFGVTLEVGRTQWLSLYNTSISTPYLPKMHLQTPMLLLRPEFFTFSVIE